jgi:hypothetical protein
MGNTVDPPTLDAGGVLRGAIIGNNGNWDAGGW